MTLYHELEGPPDAPVVVLSNSLGTTLAMWDPQLPALTSRFRVLRYDQLGHGRSPVPPGPYSLDRLGRELLELLDGLGLERVSFCGLSLGGMVGLWLGGNAPERIDRLALCCTSARLAPPELWDERAAAARSGGVVSLVEAILQRWFTAGFREREPDQIARVREMLVTTPGEGYAACCEAIRDWDFRERLGSIAAPTLVLAGGEDPATPPEHAEAIAEAVPEASLVVLPGVAHLANIEAPEPFTQAIVGHLAG